MHWIITGGTGFIGRALVQHLLQDGHVVTVLTRRTPPPEGEAQLRFVSWNGRDLGPWTAVLDGADVVVHLAGATIGRRWTPAYKRTIRDSRVLSGEVLSQAIQRVERKPKVFIQASAVGYYGARMDDMELDESSPSGDDFLAQVCVLWEATTASVEAMGVRRCVTRFGIVLERDGGALAQMLPAFRLFVGGPLGSGRQWFSWVHRLDLIRTIRFLVDRPDARGVYNVTAPNPVRLADFCRTLGRVMRRPSWMPVPPFILRMMLGEGAEVVLKGQRVVPRRLLEAGFSFQFPDVEGALRAILKGT